MSVALSLHAQGVLLPVRAQPGARKNGLRGEHNGALKVTVTQVPEKGKANAAVKDVLCRELGLRAGQVELTSGEISPQKVFLITGITLAELARRIEERLAESRASR